MSFSIGLCFELAAVSLLVSLSRIVTSIVVSLTYNVQKTDFGRRERKHVALMLLSTGRYRYIADDAASHAQVHTKAEAGRGGRALQANIQHLECQESNCERINRASAAHSGGSS